jgi:hypothetical protein
VCERHRHRLTLFSIKKYFQKPDESNKTNFTFEPLSYFSHVYGKAIANSGANAPLLVKLAFCEHAGEEENVLDVMLGEKT